ncbi:unnamed protein product [Pleuronectes platessa]|uniref:Uncharacterized protein n=1 Tax=Pleuronectes platessa TaxID=8262 RepID=A0A9N7U925_PLEPL|nr:unnamed protein product [Pleuronectes platessa]
MWCFCSPRRSDVFVSEQTRWPRNTPILGLTCTHIANPLLCYDLLQALLRCRSARVGAVNRDSVLWVYYLINPKSSAYGSSFQEPRINRGGFTLVLLHDRHHTAEITLYRYLPVVVGLLEQGLKTNEEKYLCPRSHCNRALRNFVLITEPQSKNCFCFSHSDLTKA